MLEQEVEKPLFCKEITKKGALEATPSFPVMAQHMHQFGMRCNAFWEILRCHDACCANGFAVVGVPIDYYGEMA